MANDIETKFQNMGARVKLMRMPSHLMDRLWNGSSPVTGPEPVSPRVRIDIRRDRDGEYFDVRLRSDVQAEVLDVRPADRHLLLMTRATGRGGDEDLKSKFLCGHDERAWFVAAVPEKAPARNVQSAKDALKPPQVWAAIREHGVRPDHRDRRRTAAFVRQGEWFFIPRPLVKVDEKLVLKNEPIRRGAGKPHMCQFLYREGGQEVYVSRKYPNGLTLTQLRNLPEHERRKGFRRMTRDARVYVRGSVRHRDHATVWLTHWHEVVPNTETQARAMRQVAFLD